ncbi:MAG: CBS domain-containing protein [Zoogloea sp.]|nr:CBS domain-containing protein [Zoogloea sp.]
MVREHYGPMQQSKVTGGICEIADAWTVTRVSADSPAIEVMTDLRRIPAATIAPGASLGEAHQSMVMRGVRMLLVTDAARRLAGLVTATDLLGEKPMQVGRARGVRHQELVVRDIMVPTDLLDAVSLTDVLRAEVGHVVETLRASGRQHTLVLETSPDGQPMVRGIFSASQIARQMGIPVQTTEVARTFAEIEAAIAR